MEIRWSFGGGPSAQPSAARGRYNGSMGARVLVVEDDAEIRDLIRRYLVRSGYRVVTAETGAEGLRAVEDPSIDLAVLDLGLPDIPGEEVLAAARTRDLPVVIVTARSGLENRIRGLELGADDYLTKPFSPRELLLRIQAVLHRVGTEPVSHVATYGGGLLRVDDERHEVSVDGEVVHLTPSEWGLLTALAARPGRACTRYELVNHVHGYEFTGYERTIDSHVKNLRHKLGDDPENPKVIETVVGVGYRLGLPRDE